MVTKIYYEILYLALGRHIAFQAWRITNGKSLFSYTENNNKKVLSKQKLIYENKNKIKYFRNTFEMNIN